MPGEKIGEGYVEVTVDIDDNGLNTATEKATAKVDDKFKEAAPGIGEHLGDGIDEGLAPKGEQAARTWLDNFKSRQGDFTAFAKSMGDDFYKSFEGDTDAAMTRVNQLFEEKLAAGGFDAANKFTEQFNSRVKSAFETGGDDAGRTLEQNIEKSRSQLLAFAGTMSDDFWKKWKGNSSGALDEINRLYNEKSKAGGFTSSGLFQSAWDDVFKKNTQGGSFSQMLANWGTEAAKQGTEFGDIFGNGITGGISNAFKLFASLPPEAQVAIAATAAAIVAALGSFIMAGLEGVLLGAVGGLGLAAAIVAQIKSPMITEAWNYLKTDAEDVFTEASDGLQKTIAQALNTLRAAIDSAGPDLTTWFNTIGPALGNIASAVGKVIDMLAHAFADTAPEQEAVLNELAQVIEMVGRAVADMFERFKDGGQGAVDALQFIGVMLVGLIEGFGLVMEAGAEAFTDITVVVKGLLVPIVTLINLLGDAHLIPKSWVTDVNNTMDAFGKVPATAKAAGDSVDGYGKTTQDAADATADLSNKLSDLTDQFDAMAKNGVAADQSMISYRNSLVDLKNAADQGTKSMDLGSDASANLRNHFDTAAAAALSNAEAVRQAAEAQGKTGVDASNAYDTALAGNIRQLYSTATAAGINAGAVQNMISTMFNIPKNVLTTFLQNGQYALQDFILWLNSNVHDRYMLVHVGYVTTSNQQAPPGFGATTPRYGYVVNKAAQGILAGAAPDQSSAGIYASGPVIMFAEPETGGEAFIPRNTTNPQRSLNILAEAAGWYGLSLIQNGPGNTSKATTSTGTTAITSNTTRQGNTVVQNFYGTPDPETKFNMKREFSLAGAL